jgi:Helix-turn-helix domain
MSMVEKEYFEQFDEPTTDEDDDSSIVGKAYVTIDESADFARCHPATIRRAISRRALAVCKPNGKHGRSLIRTVDLMNWLDRSRIAAVGE